MDDVVLTSRPDSRFVRALRVQLASVDAGDLGTDERTAVLEILRAVLRPCDQQLVVSGQSLEMLPVAIGRPDAAARRTAERTIEAGLRRLKEWRGCPEQALCVQRGFHCRTRSLPQRSAPASFVSSTQHAVIGTAAPLRQLPLKRQFIEPRVVKAAERRGEAAECRINASWVVTMSVTAPKPAFLANSGPVPHRVGRPQVDRQSRAGWR